MDVNGVAALLTALTGFVSIVFKVVQWLRENRYWPFTRSSPVPPVDARSAGASPPGDELRTERPLASEDGGLPPPSTMPEPTRSSRPAGDAPRRPTFDWRWAALIVVALGLAVLFQFARPIPVPCGPVLRATSQAAAANWESSTVGWVAGKGWRLDRVAGFLTRCERVVDDRHQQRIREARARATRLANGDWIPADRPLRDSLDRVRDAVVLSCE